MRSDTNDDPGRDRSIDGVDGLIDRSSLQPLASDGENDTDWTRAEHRRVARTAIEWFLE